MKIQKKGANYQSTTGSQSISQADRGLAVLEAPAGAVELAVDLCVAEKLEMLDRVVRARSARLRSESEKLN